jgi:hypothetical protein
MGKSRVDGRPGLPLYALVECEACECAVGDEREKDCGVANGRVSVLLSCAAFSMLWRIWWNLVRSLVLIASCITRVGLKCEHADSNMMKGSRKELRQVKEGIKA